MIAVVDYGLGNVQAFLNMFKLLGVEATRAKIPSDLTGASKIILPGVGAFDHAINLLNSSGMRDTLDSLILKEKIPVLGICVGMQILGKDGYEFKHEKGLNLLNFVVKKIKLKKKYALPHVGWNNVKFKKSILFDGVKQNSDFYFTHSYEVITKDKKIIIGETNYGKKLISAIGFRNVYGVQFHPEKSSTLGAKIIRNFINANA